MRINFLFHVYFFFSITIFSLEGYSQNTFLDHEVFLEEIDNSGDAIYSRCIRQYNDYLFEHPDDVRVEIEKCLFVQFAQYDEYDEYNPNQEYFDSCSANLVKKYPDNVDVLLFQTTYLWGDELITVFETAEKSIKESPEQWSDEKKAKLYNEMALTYYYDDENTKALQYIQQACLKDKSYNTSLDYVRILIEVDRNEQALEVLKAGADTSGLAWELGQKANLYLELNAYNEALALYRKIDDIDSSFNNNSELATTLEGVGEYEFAREYLLRDTANSWNKESVLRNLMVHDLNYQDGEKCLQSYNCFRDEGFLMDPLGFYRLRLFFSHPFKVWKLRDILGILMMVLTLIILVIIPFIWVLPVYFIGHHWNWIKRTKTYEPLWGLKVFWFVSAGYLIASFFSAIGNPESLYSNLNSNYYVNQITQNEEGKMVLIFILVFGCFGFASLFKKNIQVLFSTHWPIKRTVMQAIGYFFIYKLITAVYIRIGMSLGISIDQISNIPQLFLSSREDIDALLASYGTGIGFFLLCILVPMYEEIIFRGVVLDACHRYINFNTANVIQAALFATIHLNLFLFPVYFAFGMVTGILRKQSGGLLSGIVFHMINNSMALWLIIIR